MLSRADVKYLNSLQNKKYRKIEHAFLVEGLKNVCEVLTSDYKILRVLGTEKVAGELERWCERKRVVCEIVSEKELSGLGTLENNHTALAVVELKEHASSLQLLDAELVLALDAINDPGNLGTILRIADWYGISKIVCSPDTVDVYNPKVINASKGSFTRVQVEYEDLELFFERNNTIATYAACLDGTSVYGTAATLPAILLMGSEANGIKPALLRWASHKIHIPKIGGAESLNVGVATGILVDRLLGGK